MSRRASPSTSCAATGGAALSPGAAGTAAGNRGWPLAAPGPAEGRVARAASRLQRAGTAPPRAGARAAAPGTVNSLRAGGAVRQEHGRRGRGESRGCLRRRERPARLRGNGLSGGAAHGGFCGQRYGPGPGAGGQREQRLPRAGSASLLPLRESSTSRPRGVKGDPPVHLQLQKHPMSPEHCRAWFAAWTLASVLAFVNA